MRALNKEYPAIKHIIYIKDSVFHLNQWGDVKKN